ncbi:uncharacterized protein LOC135216037 isoform X2 [Macrobrachium nipponense]|uniref:uncharacterized protein LOC135216037 isoform X2 n=1 Tax=Macrobrachium nipponense TaxID=159736 RepID=UPI0030C83310
MRSRMVLICALLLPLGVTGFPNPSGGQAYQLTSVHNVESNADESGGIWDIAFALMPQIESLVQNVTQQASSSSLKDAERFKDIIQLFIPFMRKTLEFQAEDEGRKVSADEFEVLDAVEFALHHISQLASSAIGTGSSSGDSFDPSSFLPDYTDLLLDIPDVNIPPVVIPETKIPELTIPEINIPGGSDIPEKKITFQNIPEVNIPGKTVPVTSGPLTDGLRRTKPATKGSTTSNKSPSRILQPQTTTAKPIRATTTQKPVKLRPTEQMVKTPTPEGAPSRGQAKGPRRTAPSSVLREKLFATEGRTLNAENEAKQTLPFRHVPQSGGDSEPTTVVHSLPGGGFFYRVTQ